MQDFFDRFKPKKQEKNTTNSNKSNNNNVLGNLFNGFSGSNNNGSNTSSIKTFTGEGKSLGGTTQLGKVIPIELKEPGPLGIMIEQRPNTLTSIVSQVVPNSQADRAGIQRGDILCYSGSNGKEEILHSLFIELAKSYDQRPLCFEVRRIETKKTTTSTSASTGTGSINAAAGSGTGTGTGNDATMTAEAYARKQAMIAAAEAREKKFKQATKPVKTGFVPKTTSTSTSTSITSLGIDNGTTKVLSDGNTKIPLSEASRHAMQIAKENELKTVAELGYNPYEVNSVTAGQARNAVTTVSHGTIQNPTITTSASTSGSGSPSISSSSSTAATGGIPSVSAPTDPGLRQQQQQQATTTITTNVLPPVEFQNAFETLVTSNHDIKQVKNSISVLIKLINNAITKGSNFHKVRLENPKIKEAIVNVHGAIDIMEIVGFQLMIDEENNNNNNESVLLYIPEDEYEYDNNNNNNNNDINNTSQQQRRRMWIPSAIKQMEMYNNDNTISFAT